MLLARETGHPQLYAVLTCADQALADCGYIGTQIQQPERGAKPCTKT
jgi:hypothetical protein